MLERISALFTFAVDQDWIEANPAWRIKAGTGTQSRSRAHARRAARGWPLHETEAKNADGTPKPRLSQTLNDVFLVMLTAQRCGEVCQCAWREVDLDTGWWLIPGNVSKNHDPHRVRSRRWSLKSWSTSTCGERRRPIRVLELTVTPVWLTAQRRRQPSSARRRLVPLPHDLRRTAAYKYGRSGRRPLPHRARAQPSQRHAQHGDGYLRPLPLRQGEARGARKMG